jgi:NTE family protein
MLRHMNQSAIYRYCLSGWQKCRAVYRQLATGKRAEPPQAVQVAAEAVAETLKTAAEPALQPEPALAFRDAVAANDALHAPSLPPKRRISLALQGGGSHGAITWGVLDRLLQDENLEFDAISGTSAGAVNAAVMTCGYVRAGRAGARAALFDCWQGISAAGARFQVFKHPWLNPLVNPLTASWTQALNNFSPYQLNPLGSNPLRELLLPFIDDAELRQFKKWQLLIAATEVQSGQLQIFSNGAANDYAASLDAVLASACLPQLFKAVEIKGTAYWDGGYTSNPCVAELLRRPACQEIVIIELGAAVEDATRAPFSRDDIDNRATQISFGAPLAAELRMLAAIQARLPEQAQVLLPTVHMLRPELQGLDAASKLDTDAKLLQRLFDAGYAAADAWLAEFQQAQASPIRV